MKIILKKRGEDEGISYDIPSDGIILPDVLGNWSLEARPKTPYGEIRLLLWSADKRPDYMGRIHPVRQSILNFFHPEVKFRRGLFGLGGALQVTRSMKP